MLTVLNSYAHGYISVPVILACKNHGLFHILEENTDVSFQQLVAATNANEGYLRIALHMLQSLNWINSTHNDKYHLNRATAIYKQIPDEIGSLLSFPIQAYLEKENDTTLQPWISLSANRWHIKDPVWSTFLDGLLIITILLAMRERDWLRTTPDQLPL